MIDSQKDSNSVIDDVVSSSYNTDEIWKPIPYYPRYEAGSYGNIRSLSDRTYHRIMSQHENKTSVGTYKVICAYNQDTSRKTVEVHKLICMAFNGLPPSDGKKYEVNHKDGNKHNNVPDNLEWITRKENTLHALRSGLRNDNIRLRVHDNVSDMWTEYYSLMFAANEMAIPRNDLKVLIARHQTVRYKNRWLFEIDLSRSGLINRDNFKKIKAYDYVADKEIFADNCTYMSYLTGVLSGTIALNAGLKGTLKFGLNRLISGYVFKLESDNTPYPQFDKIIAIASRNDYIAKQSVDRRKRNSPVVYKNHITSETRVFDNVQEASEITGINKGTLKSLLVEQTKGDIKIHKGMSFKRDDDSREFPCFSDMKVSMSMESNSPHINPIRVCDIISNTTKVYCHAADFARAIGTSIYKTSLYVQRSGDKPFLGRYVVERLST